MLSLTVAPDGQEPYELEVSTRDVLIWEKAGRGRSMSKLFGDLHMADVYSVAHISLNRQQLFTGSLADFEATCDLKIEKVMGGLDGDRDGEDDTDPTQQDL